MKTLLPSLVLLSTVAHGMDPIPKHDDLSLLLEGQRPVTSLTLMERQNLLQGETKIELWSGSYWPQYQGSLGVRYRDPLFMQLMEGEDQWDKFQDLKEKTPMQLYSGREDLLSPAEKYDLLVGDHGLGLTKYAWGLGNKNQILGHVPTWRGICDGWASASQMMPRPRKTVTMKTPSGLSINFFPEDIKALGSLLYARAQDNVIFIGKRCRSPLIGVFNSSCDGTNPGAFHNALVNRVGVMKKTFIADVSPSSEVWNYPVKSYSMSFYNVFTNQEFKSFRDALEVFDKKKGFRKKGSRHKQTAYVVGVKAVVNYADMRPANLLPVDGPEADLVMQKEYWYDLELDRNFHVIGGVWAGNVRPDFIWAPNDGTYPLSLEESLNGKPRNPRQLAEMANASSKRGHPLSVVVQELFELSK